MVSSSVPPRKLHYLQKSGKGQFNEFHEHTNLSQRTYVAVELHEICCWRVAGLQPPLYGQLLLWDELSLRHGTVLSDSFSPYRQLLSTDSKRTQAGGLGNIESNFYLCFWFLNNGDRTGTFGALPVFPYLLNFLMGNETEPSDECVTLVVLLDHSLRPYHFILGESTFTARR